MNATSAKEAVGEDLAFQEGGEKRMSISPARQEAGSQQRSKSEEASAPPELHPRAPSAHLFPQSLL